MHTARVEYSENKVGCGKNYRPWKNDLGKDKSKNIDFYISAKQEKKEDHSFNSLRKFNTLHYESYYMPPNTLKLDKAETELLGLTVNYQDTKLFTSRK